MPRAATIDPDVDDEVTATGGRVRRALVLGLLAVTLAIGGAAGYQLYQEKVERTPEAFCRQLPVVRDLDRSLGNLDAVGVRQDLTQLEQLQASSPAEVEPSVAVLVETTRSLLGPLDQANDDGGKAVQEAWRARAADAGRIAEAGRTVQAYAKTTCGIDLNDPAG